MIKHVGATSVANILRAVLQFVLNVVLAHYLSPHDFGTIALILPVALFILLIGDFGLSSAIVRARSLEEPISGAALATCALVGGTLCLLTTLLSLASVAAHGDTKIALVAVLMSAAVGLALAAITPRAILERELKYPRIATIESIAVLLGFGASVTAAAAGAGVAAFGVYHIVMQSTRCVAFLVQAHGKYKLNLDIARVAPLFAFGGWVVAFNIINYVARNLDNYIIGSVLGRTALGTYALSYQIMLVPLMALTWPASGVLLSTLRRHAGQSPSTIASLVLPIMSLTSLLTFPAMTFVALEVNSLAELFLPASWSHLASVLMWLAPAGALQSVTSYVGAVLTFQGKVRLQLVTGAISTAAILITVFTAAVLTHNLAVVAAAYFLETVFATLAYFALLSKVADIRFRKVALACFQGLLCALAGGTVVLAIDKLLAHSDQILASAAKLIGFIIAWCASAYIFRGNLLTNLKALSEPAQSASIEK